MFKKVVISDYLILTNHNNLYCTSCNVSTNCSTKLNKTVKPQCSQFVTKINQQSLSEKDFHYFTIICNLSFPLSDQTFSIYTPPE